MALESDRRMFNKILRRVTEQFPEADEPSIRMMLIDVHYGACPLRLEALADAPDMFHDVFGLLKHFDTHTHQIKDCFWPRYAQ